MLLQQYELNVVPNQRIGTVTVNASQYDKDSRTIRMAMYNGEVPFQIPSGANVYVIGTKADSTGYQYECTYVANQNIVTFDIQPQMTVLPGFHTAEIRVTKDGEILGSANFKFQIERGALSDDTVISDTDLPLVEKAAEAVDALEEVTDAIEAATAVLENIDPIAQAVQANALKSEGYAVGEQDGTPVESGTYYHNNSKYYSEQASTSATNAHTSEVNAGDSETNALSYKNSASQSASDALGYKNNASASATTASNEALKSEGYAVGKQNGTDVSSGTYYHNNAKYFSEQASTSATNAHTSEVNAGLSQSSASGSATSASNSALVSEGWAKGSQNGTDVTSGSPYYENNSKYYSEVAGEIKTEMEGLLDNVAMQDGYYDTLTSGNLTTNISETDKVPYNFRTSGGSLDIGAYEEDTLVGGSLGWNQLVKDPLFTETSNWIPYDSAKASVSISDGTATLTYLTSGNGGYTFGMKYYTGLYPAKTIVGHKYLLLVQASPSKNMDIYMDFSGSGRQLVPSCSAGVWTSCSAVVSCNDVRDGYILQPGYSSGLLAENDTLSFRKPMIFDLTLLFGSAIADYIYTLATNNAGAGVAYFKKYFPKDYYSYVANSLESVYASKHNMNGFNQWDEEWEVGEISSSTGQNMEGYLTIWRSKNYIHVFPNTQYHAYADKNGTPSLRARFYDADKNYIGYLDKYDNHVAMNVDHFTTPSNCYYMRFCPNISEIPTGTKVCINLQWDGERDGEYEAYTLHSYDLDPVILRGYPVLDSNNNIVYIGDKYKSDGTVERIMSGDVNMGTLTYTYVSSLGMFATQIGIKKPTTYEERKTGFKCSLYSNSSTYVLNENMDDKSILRDPNGDYIYIKDSSYNGDTNAFKTAMNGVYITYELETPTTESADPYTNPQWVDNWGTEEYVDYGVSQNTRDVAIPVGHETIYPVDLKAKLETSPDVPNGDGVYLMKQENGVNTYIQYVGELPSDPSGDGTYVLKCTVSSGNATLTWESQS